MGDSGIRKVFLSSTAEDLKDHRAAVVEALAGLDEVKVVNQEGFGARSGKTVDTCKKLVRECDLVVAVVGHRYGWVPQCLNDLIPRPLWEQPDPLGRGISTFAGLSCEWVVPGSNQ